MSNDRSPWDNANTERSGRGRSGKGRSGNGRPDRGHKKPGQGRTRSLGPRSFAASAVAAVVDDGKSLNEVMADRNALDPRDSALAQELTYGTLREYWSLRAIADARMTRQLKPKDGDVLALLLVGLYQLRSTRVKTHAAVSETVAGVNDLGKSWARGFINAILRSELRDPTPVAEPNDPTSHWNHPQWLLDQLFDAWPDHASAALRAANTQSPMVLRVNSAKTTRDEYLAELARADIKASTVTDAADALLLEQPVAVSDLPDFQDGAVSVQDLSAQLAVDALAPQPGERILDACAAPGGKSAHILERCAGDVELTAIDSDERRLMRVHENLERLGYSANIAVADAAQHTQWWDENAYDRILIDAPCSGTGVISRHPDIKHLRRPSDLQGYASTQNAIIDSLWQTLKPGGTMVYATCSILPAENAERMQAFFDRTPDAQELDPGEKLGLRCTFGRQRLPGTHTGDGFYYCVARRAT